MDCVPYGYKIVNGKAEADKERAETVRKLFDGYISGLGLQAAANAAGLNISHSVAGGMLRNTHYIGDNYYPAIIDKETFDKAEEIRLSRAVSLGRVKELKPPPKPRAETRFKFRYANKRFSDSFEQAEYAYSLIESEAANDE